VDRALETALLRRLHTLEGHFVERDEKIFPEEKIQLTGRKHAVLAAVVHRVNHHEKIRRKLVLVLRGIFLDLGRRAHRYAVLNRQRVEVENILQHTLRFLRARLLQIEPEKQIGVRQEGGHEEHLNVLAVQLALGGEGE